MFQNHFKRFGRYARLHWIAHQIRNGVIPVNVEQAEMYEALRHTKQPNVLEMFGFLRVRVMRKAGHIWRVVYPEQLVSVRKVTTAFANYVVDSLQNATSEPLDVFTWHDMGDDNTAEDNSHTGLQNSRESRVDGNQGENGANIYQSVGTITATAGYDVEEHGIFSASTGGTMLDRNLVSNAPTVVSDDQVEFTYELTVNAES